MSNNPYQDSRGNKDASIANPKPAATLTAHGTADAGTPDARAGEPFLIGDAMTGGYGTGADILHGCTISVDEGQIAVIVGPNGAGKSTAMKAVFGMLNVREGAVRLNGEDITNLTPQARVAKGMAFVPQTSNIFTSMTVEENLEWVLSCAQTTFAAPSSRSMTCSPSCVISAIKPQASFLADSASRSQ